MKKIFLLILITSFSLYLFSQTRLPQSTIDNLNKCPYDSVERITELKSISFTAYSTPGEAYLEMDEELEESLEELDKQLEEMKESLPKRARKYLEKMDTEMNAEEYESQNNAELAKLEELMGGGDANKEKKKKNSDIPSMEDMMTYKQEYAYMSPNFIYSKTTSPSPFMEALQVRNDQWGLYVKDDISYDLNTCKYILPFDNSYSIMQNMYELTQGCTFNDTETIDYEGLKAERLIGECRGGTKVTITYEPNSNNYLESVMDMGELGRMTTKNVYINLNGFLLPKETLSYMNGKLAYSVSYLNYKLNQEVDKEIFYTKEF